MKIVSIIHKNVDVKTESGNFRSVSIFSILIRALEIKNYGTRKSFIIIKFKKSVSMLGRNILLIFQNYEYATFVFKIHLFKPSC